MHYKDIRISSQFRGLLGTGHYLSPGGDERGGGMSGAEDLGLNKVKFRRSPH